MRRVCRAALVTLAVVAAGGPAIAQDAGQEPVLKLVSPGRAPLRALRYQVPAGYQGRIDVTMGMAMATSVGGQALPSVPTPEMRYTATYRVTEVTPAGDMRYEFDLGGFEAVAAPGVPPAVLEGVRAAFDTLKGVRGRARVDARGITREADLDVPPGAPPQVKALLDSLRQSIRQFSAPLPEEPVGPGARWDTTYRINMNGVVFEQTGRHQLTSLDGNHGRLAIAITQSAPPQRIKDPSLPAGAVMDLVDVKSTGEAANEFDLSRLAPASATMKLTMKMKTRVKMGEQAAQDVDTSMDMSMTLKSRRINP